MKINWYTISIYMKQLMSVVNTFIESNVVREQWDFVFYTTISIFTTSFWDIAENDKNVASWMHRSRVFLVFSQYVSIMQSRENCGNTLKSPWFPYTNVPIYQMFRSARLLLIFLTEALVSSKRRLASWTIDVNWYN